MELSWVGQLKKDLNVSFYLASLFQTFCSSLKQEETLWFLWTCGLLICIMLTLINSDPVKKTVHKSSNSTYFWSTQWAQLKLSSLFLLISAGNKCQQHQNNFYGTPRIEPRAAWWEAIMLPLRCAAPSPQFPGQLFWWNLISVNSESQG